MIYEKRLSHLRQPFFVSAWKFYDLTFMKISMLIIHVRMISIVGIPLLRGDEQNPWGIFKGENLRFAYLMKPTCFEMISYCSSFF